MRGGPAVSGAQIQVAVVGHTNAGKTSLMRTLSRDAGFGEVASSPGTTRHVEATALLVEGAPVMELYDTPGLEDSIALLHRLERSGDAYADGVERIERFLNSRAAEGEFEQEAKVLRQVLASDLVLYVVDARESMMGRHRDELTLLGYSARPVVPVLNFTASSESQEPRWRALLARLGLHAVVAFDTVLYDLAGEQRLFEKMQSLLDTRYEALQALIEERRRLTARLREAGLASVAELLVDTAALQLRAPPGSSAALEAHAEDLRQRVRERERRCLREMLETFAFRPEDIQDPGLDIRAGQWRQDLFAPETLRAFGISAGGGAVTGAAIGMGVDALTGGLSLGAATLLGATAGALLGTARSHGQRALDRLRGFTLLRVDETTLRLLAGRGLELLRALMRRGHASLTPLELGRAAGPPPWAQARLPAPLATARGHPHWSSLADAPQRFEADAARAEAVSRLQRALGQWLEQAAPGADAPARPAATPPGPD